MSAEEIFVIDSADESDGFQSIPSNDDAEDEDVSFSSSQSGDRAPLFPLMRPSYAATISKPLVEHRETCCQVDDADLDECRDDVRRKLESLLLAVGGTALLQRAKRTPLGHSTVASDSSDALAEVSKKLRKLASTHFTPSVAAVSATANSTDSSGVIVDTLTTVAAQLVRIAQSLATTDLHSSHASTAKASQSLSTTSASQVDFSCHRPLDSSCIDESFRARMEKAFETLASHAAAAITAETRANVNDRAEDYNPTVPIRVTKGPLSATDNDTLQELLSLRQFAADHSVICTREGVPSFHPLYDELVRLRSQVAMHRHSEMSWLESAASIQRDALHRYAQAAAREGNAGFAFAVGCRTAPLGDHSLRKIHDNVEAIVCENHKLAKEIERIASRGGDHRSIPRSACSSEQQFTASSLRTSGNSVKQLLASRDAKIDFLTSQLKAKDEALRNLTVKLESQERSLLDDETKGNRTLSSAALEQVRDRMKEDHDKAIAYMRVIIEVLIGRRVVKVRIPTSASEDQEETIVVAIEDLGNNRIHEGTGVKEYRFSPTHHLRDLAIAEDVATSLIGHITKCKEIEAENARSQLALICEEEKQRDAVQALEDSQRRLERDHCDKESHQLLAAAAQAALVAHLKQEAAAVFDNPLADDVAADASMLPHCAELPLTTSSCECTVPQGHPTDTASAEDATVSVCPPADDEEQSLVNSVARGEGKDPLIQPPDNPPVTTAEDVVPLVEPVSRKRSRSHSPPTRNLSSRRLEEADVSIPPATPLCASECSNAFVSCNVAAESFAPSETTPPVAAQPRAVSPVPTLPAAEDSRDANDSCPIETEALAAPVAADTAISHVAPQLSTPQRSQPIPPPLPETLFVDNDFWSS